MIFDFLKKQKENEKKRKIIEILIFSLDIPNEQKELYLGAISDLSLEGLDKIYLNLLKFSKKLEEEKLNDIGNSNLSQIAGIKKKEAKEKQKELNSFSFLISNL